MLAATSYNPRGQLARLIYGNDGEVFYEYNNLEMCIRDRPCLTASVAMLNTRIKLMGPLATPPVELTVLPLGRRREKEKPVPPPDL